MQLTRYLVVEDQPMMVDAMLDELRQDASLIHVGSAQNLDEATRLIRSKPADLAILDISLQGAVNTDGLEAARCFRQVNPQGKIVFFSGFFDSCIASRAAEFQPYGYMDKMEVGDYLLATVRAALRGEQPRHGAIPKGDAADQYELTVQRLLNASQLTLRQAQVGALIACYGMSDQAIGQRLHIAEKTVRNHITGVLDILGVDNRTQIAIRIRDPLAVVV